MKITRPKCNNSRRLCVLAKKIRYTSSEEKMNRKDAIN